MARARNNIDAAIELCSCYPSEHAVIQNIRTPNKPFTFLFDDISLKSIMSYAARMNGRIVPLSHEALGSALEV
ncbi:hypothetical protein PILCRDRAFT_812536 [Piloderma croceum F 1598]|uniref:Uncharacterized protein n=1 Tax=Piloderma croceum (strain F 1598) TaxID=765440 RepID=A0A0C3G0K7_PILCF|nr:hypothetical protein PILCRDRAFT_812536 [Piloderma croceum F 1598]